MVHSMWDAFPELKEELEDTVSLIDRQITIRNEVVRERIRAMLVPGGKLLRPAYSILFSQYTENRDPLQSHAIAAALEVLHIATLIHDDVIDEAKTRRGQETLNKLYDNRVAVYTGDYLFTVCFRLLDEYAGELSSIQLDRNGMENILIGELNQMSMQYNTRMTLRNYLNQIKGKTAQLFALSCYSGAYQKKEDEQLARLAYRIGHNLGMAFQIIDDVLDYTQTEQQVGKPVMHDFREGIYTAPLLFAMQKRRAEFEPYMLLREAITDRELQEVYDLVIKYKGEQAAFELARKYTQKALRLIGKLPQNATTATIKLLTEQVLARTL